MNAKRKNSIRWKYFYTVILGASIFTSRLVYANAPVPTPAEWIQWIRMQDMHWVQTLSVEQVDEVRSALGSGYYPLVEAALTNVILHRLSALLPVIEKGVNTPETAAARPFRKICADALNTQGDPFQKLRQVLTTELPGDKFIPNCETTDYCRLVRHMVTSLIVFDEFRAVRAGRKKEADLHGLELSEFETELVKFSRFKVTAAVDKILQELSKAQLIGKRESILVQVLHTYAPKTYFPLVLTKLELNLETDGYGIKLLLGSLRFRCDKLDKAGKAQLRSIIESIRQGGQGSSLERTLTALESEL